MTGAEFKELRETLGRALGRRVSQQDLGVALGLAGDNAKRLVRRWEEDGPTGPAALALRLMVMALERDAGEPADLVRGLFSAQRGE